MLTLKTSRYFNSLPQNTQEIVLRSGENFESEEDILNFLSGFDS